MARVIGTATVEVKADTSAFRTGLESVGSTASSAFGKVAGVVAGLGLGKLAKDAIDFGQEYRIQLDNAAAAVSGLVDNQDQAKSLLEEMTSFAINTPFSLPGVQESVSQLLAVGKGFGVTAENAVDYATTIGNVTAITGGSDDTMRRIVRVLGQMSSSGKILGQDMNQLAQNIPGFDVWQALADGTGKSKEELRKLQDEGKLDELLTGNEAVAMLTAGMEKMNTKFEENSGGASAMEAKMQTLGGTMEMFKDTMGVALANGLQPFFGALQGLLKNPAIQKGLTALATGFGELASEIMDELGPVLPDLVDSFLLIVKALVPLAPVLALIVKAFAQMLIVVAPVINILASLIGWFAKLISTLDPTILGIITAALVAMWLGVSGPLPIIIGLIAVAVVVIGKLLNSLGISFEDVVKVIKGAWDWLWENLIQPTIEFVQQLIDPFVDLYNVLVGNSIIPDLVNAIIGFFQMLFGTLIGIVTAIVDAIVAVWDTLWGFIESALNIIKAGVELYFNTYKTIITTIINAIAAVVSTVFNGIKSTISGIWDTIKSLTQTAWNLIRDYVKAPITEAVDWVGKQIDKVVDFATKLPGRMSGLFTGMWDGIKTAFKSAVNFVIRGWNSLEFKIPGFDPPGPGPSFGGFTLGVPDIPLLANGALLNSPTLAVLAERGPEAVIPLTNPFRAFQLMQQSGLDRLADKMGGGRFGGPLVTMPGAIIQDATDADLVAQRTLVAMQAAMIPA